MTQVLRPRTLILSPFAGDTHRNIQYAKDCMLDSIGRGEAPFASHLLYTQVLYDNIAEQRFIGFECEAAWAKTADSIIAYTDLGWSEGMYQTWGEWQTRWNMPDDKMHSRALGGVWAEAANV